MKKNFGLRAVALLFASLLLCGFTDGSTDKGETSQSRFDSEVQSLDADLDKTAILGSNLVEVENQLSDSEYQTIHEFIQIEETHIELDEKVYSWSLCTEHAERSCHDTWRYLLSIWNRC